MNGFKSSTMPIGLDLGAATLRAVQLQRRGDGWALRDAVEIKRLAPGAAFGAEEAARLAGVLRRRSFVGRDLIVSLPNRDLVRGLVEVASAKGATESDAFLEAAEEIERTHRLEPGGYELAAWLPPTSGNRRQTAVCVNGCRHDVAESLLSAFEAVGLNVLAIDSRACAIGRVLDPHTAGEPGLTAVLDIEPDATELVLLHRGGVAYQRPLIDAGLDQAIQRLADHDLNQATAQHCLDHIGLGDSETGHGVKIRGAIRGYVTSLVQEAGPALDYASRMFTELPVRRFAVVGQGAAVPGLSIELQQQLGIDTASGLAVAVAGLHDRPACGVALGLALHPQEVSWAAA